MGLGGTEGFVSDAGRAADVAGEDNTVTENKISITPILKVN